MQHNFRTITPPPWIDGSGASIGSGLGGADVETKEIFDSSQDSHSAALSLAALHVASRYRQPLSRAALIAALAGLGGRAR